MGMFGGITKPFSGFTNSVSKPFSSLSNTLGGGKTGDFGVAGLFLGGPLGMFLGMEVGSQLDQIKMSQELANIQNKSIDESKKQYEEARKIAEIKDIRSRRDAIRMARVHRATLANYAANSGTQNSSGAAGASASIGSQLGSNLGYFSATQDAQSTIFDSQVVQAGYEQQAGGVRADIAKTQAIGNIAGIGFNAGMSAAKFFI